ncbi:hypothetical protein [Thiohalorhabdus methylotrophus]|uniref:Uncharacterized protein n=1 Tax=Thiohalorhabdus methylotrophus TaxID=3242694 RepID=A0ABV4TUH7_9GAMM
MEIRSRTGSLIVHHEPGALTDIKAVLEDLGILLAGTTDVGTELERGAGPGSVLINAVNDLNRRLRLSSRGLLDLRILVPAGFAGLAVRQALRHGLQIEAAPWYLLAYLAFDSFVKLHPPQGAGSGTIPDR